VHDAVAESVLVEELEVGADARRDGRLATAEDHGPDEELALVDQAGFEGLGSEARPPMVRLLVVSALSCWTAARRVLREDRSQPDRSFARRLKPSGSR
jgi:hypothetical protein